MKKLISFILIAVTLLSIYTPALAVENTTDYEYIAGDANADGTITAEDARIILRISASLIKADDEMLKRADFDGNGKVLAIDARYTLRVSAMLDPYTPETTTKVPETTTKAPETTTKAPVTTTRAPETTTSKVLTPDNREYKVEMSDLFSAKYAKYAVLYDYDNDKILYGKNMHSRCHPASTTKLITAYIASLYLDDNYVIKVGKELNLVDWNTSRAGIQQGQRIKFKEMLKCLLLPSGCDAAYAIAAATARVASGNPSMPASDAIRYFVNLMNKYAKKWGMNDSHFANPDGFPNSKHYTSAYDMTIIAVKAYSNDLIRKTAAMTYATARFESGGSKSYANTNELINPDSSKYYPYCVGLKTGSHTQAGKCLVTVAKKYIKTTNKTKTFIAVVYNCPTKEGRFYDLRNMYNTAFSYFWRQP